MYPEGPIGEVLAPDLPPLNEDTFVCLRGPCRFYWEVVSDANLGNVEGSLPDGFKGQFVNRFCTRLSGDADPSLFEQRIYECSEWDPQDGNEARRREKRREKYFQIRRSKEAAVAEKQLREDLKP